MGRTHLTTWAGRTSQGEVTSHKPYFEVEVTPLIRAGVVDTHLSHVSHMGDGQSEKTTIHIEITLYSWKTFLRREAPTCFQALHPVLCSLEDFALDKDHRLRLLSQIESALPGCSSITSDGVAGKRGGITHAVRSGVPCAHLPAVAAHLISFIDRYSCPSTADANQGSKRWESDVAAIEGAKEAGEVDSRYGF